MAFGRYILVLLDHHIHLIRQRSLEYGHLPLHVLDRSRLSKQLYQLDCVEQEC